MTKFKVIVTFEYEVNNIFDCYETNDPNVAAKIDEKTFNENPETIDMMLSGEGIKNYSVKVKPII